MDMEVNMEIYFKAHYFNINGFCNLHGKSVNSGRGEHS